MKHKDTPSDPGHAVFLQIPNRGSKYGFLQSIHPQEILALAKVFCRAKFWAKFPFSRGVVRREVFGEVWCEVFGKVFGLVFAWTFGAPKTSVKTSAQKPHASDQQNLAKIEEKIFMTRFCRADPCQS